MGYGVEGNAALVTTSSSGLGKASAKALVSEGENVVINGRGEGRLSDARDEVAKAGSGRVVAQSGDLTDSADITELVETPSTSSAASTTSSPRLASPERPTLALPAAPSISAVNRPKN